jgi:hypothetical protein
VIVILSRRLVSTGVRTSHYRLAIDQDRKLPILLEYLVGQGEPQSLCHFKTYDTALEAMDALISCLKAHLSYCDLTAWAVVPELDVTAEADPRA